jgi:hypothetical protein
MIVGKGNTNINQHWPYPVTAVNHCHSVQEAGFSVSKHLNP